MVASYKWLSIGKINWALANWLEWEVLVSHVKDSRDRLRISTWRKKPEAGNCPIGSAVVRWMKSQTRGLLFRLFSLRTPAKDRTKNQKGWINSTGCVGSVHTDGEFVLFCRARCAQCPNPPGKSPRSQLTCSPTPLSPTRLARTEEETSHEMRSGKVDEGDNEGGGQQKPMMRRSREHFQDGKQNKGTMIKRTWKA